ncbi:MAG TPA: hypothetical protein VGW76_13795 [Pyrinomonadaceae bacterium]|nr:hypothetical protein [Pyrinomonadaceae bacterium]
MPPTHICTQPTSPCITIDGTNDDEALRNARIAFYGPSGIGPLHDTTSQAVTNLLTCLSPGGSLGRVMMVGHGSPGKIMTGSGAVANDLDKRIEFGNFNRWKITVRRLRSQTTELTFCSCDTGADVKGAKLLMKVANHIEATVSGFTGQIFIDATGTITCEPGGYWQHAYPGIDLPPVPAPIHHFEEVVDLRLKYGEEYRTVKIKDVRAVSFSDVGEGKLVFSLTGEAAQKLVGTINFAEPSEIDGAPLALNTGTLRIKYLIDEKPDERTFTVYNDRLLFDQSTPNTFYFASPDLAKLLDKYRSEFR